MVFVLYPYFPVGATVESVACVSLCWEWKNRTFNGVDGVDGGCGTVTGIPRVVEMESARDSQRVDGRADYPRLTEETEECGVVR